MGEGGRIRESMEDECVGCVNGGRRNCMKRNHLYELTQMGEGTEGVCVRRGGEG